MKFGLEYMHVQREASEINKNVLLHCTVLYNYMYIIDVHVHVYLTNSDHRSLIQEEYFHQNNGGENPAIESLY